jgi:alanine dehydrogenase
VTTTGAHPVEILFLSQAEVERLLDVDAMLDALEAAFREVSAGATSVPPRVAASTPHGVLAVMPGYLPSAGLETKLVSLFPGNHERGLPSHQALIALFDPETGAPQAVMDGTHITAMRTGGGSAVATRFLARPDARVLAILGAGVQGRSHLATVGRVRDFEEIRIASRNPAHARDLAATDARARAVESFEEAARGADVVCCCTHSTIPVLSFEWLRPGAHVNSVGANFEGPELDEATVRQGHLFVESDAAFQPPPAGAAELVGVDPGAGTGLGAALSGSAEGRRSAEEITVYKSMGHAAEDAATARLVYQRALREGAGSRIPL